MDTVRLAKFNVTFRIRIVYFYINNYLSFILRLLNLCFSFSKIEKFVDFIGGTKPSWHWEGESKYKFKYF